MKLAQRLQSSPLSKVQTRKELGNILGLFEWFEDYPSKSDLRYTKYPIEKREVEQPVKPLAKVQRAMHEAIIKHVPTPEYIYTFKGNIGNAVYHRYYPETLVIDISKFFPSTPSGRIYHFFNQGFGFSKAVSSLATDLTAFEGHLPTGAPTSPILGYWVNAPMWAKINHYCEIFNCVLTVYMDDLTISGKFIRPELERKIIKTIKSYGYKISVRKCQRYKRGDIKNVTGVAILPDGKLQASAKTYEKAALLALMLEELDDREVEDQMLDSLKGINGYIRSVENKNAFAVQPSC